MSIDEIVKAFERGIKEGSTLTLPDGTRAGKITGVEADPNGVTLTLWMDKELAGGFNMNVENLKQVDAFKIGDRVKYAYPQAFGMEETPYGRVVDIDWEYLVRFDDDVEEWYGSHELRKVIE